MRSVVELVWRTTPSRPSLLPVGCLISLSLLVFSVGGSAQTRRSTRNESHSQPPLSGAERDLVNLAIGVVCNERKMDPQGSVSIDEMQARPSLPVHSPEALSGAERAERLLPVAKSLVINSLRRLAADYNFPKPYRARLELAIIRV